MLKWCLARKKPEFGTECTTVHFPVRITRVGQHRLVVSAVGEKISDAVSHEIQVRPSGHRIEDLENGTLKTKLEYSCPNPEEAIAGASSLRVKLFPTRFSEIVEGLDSIFQEPHGCFEQTSSTTYPNVLTLDYLKTMGLLKPESAAKARRYINEGYQRLLTFEVAGGGFEWFGHSPANICLTAYGVLEFSDMARVHPIDQKVINRTVQWLDSQQNADGSWNSGRALHSWSQNPALITAYVAWALAETGNQSSSLEKALNYLRSQNSDLMRAVDLSAHLVAGTNHLELRQQPPGELPCQMSFVRWLPDPSPSSLSNTSAPPPLRIDLEFDRTCLSVKETLQARFSVQNNSGKTLSMVMVDLGIPPGFEVDPSVFQAMQSAGQIAKFESSHGRVVLYLRELPPEKPFAFGCSLAPKYPLRVEMPRASAYEYYTPQKKAFSQFAQIEVK